MRCNENSYGDGTCEFYKVHFPLGSLYINNTGFNDEGKGNVVYLDRHNVDCGKDSILSQFNLLRNGEEKYRYNYKCKSSNKPLQCRDVTTTINDDGNGNAVFLDRHDVVCADDEVLNQFKLVRPTDKTIQYQYKCCKYAPQESITPPMTTPTLTMPPATDSKELNLDATTGQPINQDLQTIIARRDDSVLETKTFKYHYIGWILVLVFIIWAIMNVSMFSFSGIDIGSMGSEFAPSQTPGNAFSMIIIIILVIISVLIINKMNSSHIQTNVKIYGK
jgi:hypothetical protein